MVTKKDLVIVALATFCLTATLFMIMPTKSNPSIGEYDPWVDLNDDGIVDIYDALRLAAAYGTSGTPINKTVLLFSHWYDELLAYWKFDEGSGTVAMDSSGNNNNGTITGNPSWVEGKYLGGLSLDGDDYMYVGSSSSIVIHQCVSVECWVKVFGSTGDHQVLLTQNTESIPHYTLEFQPDGRTVEFAVHPPGQNVYAASQVQIDFGEWAHIVGTYNGTHACIYVNGICTGYLYCPGLLDVVDFPVWIGSHTPASTWDRNWFNGTIDNIMLYNTTLSAEEILAHYLLPPP